MTNNELSGVCVRHHGVSQKRPTSQPLQSCNYADNKEVGAGSKNKTKAARSAGSNSFTRWIGFSEDDARSRRALAPPTNGPRAGRLHFQRVEDNAFHLRTCDKRLIANSVLHLCGGFHNLRLHHWHYICHVSTKFLHRRFSDGRAIKISQCLQFISGEIFYHRIYHRLG